MMILVNDSYNDSEVRVQMKQICGSKVGFWKSLRKGGIGIGNLRLLELPVQFASVISGNHDQLFASIELRENGLILRFKRRTETYAVLLPSNEIKGIIIKPYQGERKLLCISSAEGELSLSCISTESQDVRNRIHAFTGVRCVEEY